MPGFNYLNWKNPYITSFSKHGTAIGFLKNRRRWLGLNAINLDVIQNDILPGRAFHIDLEIKFFDPRPAGDFGNIRSAHPEIRGAKS